MKTTHRICPRFELAPTTCRLQLRHTILPLGHRAVLIDISIHVIILTIKSLTLIIISYVS
jgi:hypothetical protein